MTAVPCVDWQVAAATGGFLVPPGVDVERAEATAIVADLRDCAALAVDAVASASELPGPADSAVLIVGRSAWLEATVAMTESMLTRIGQQPPATLGEKVGSRLAGAQLGAALAFVATRILGQFDPYSATPRLLLVAPNIVATEATMGVQPHGFRQWVCLHEQTHAAQFGAAPWLPSHLLELMRRMFADDAEGVVEENEGAPSQAAREAGPATRLMSAGQVSTFDTITAVMSLLEGHADVIMDRAAPGLVPQVGLLRAAMETRRDAPGLVQLISRVLGLRAKRDQYRYGATFCREVIDSAGVGTLNQAFERPDLLPTLTELHDAGQWLSRVSQRVR